MQGLEKSRTTLGEMVGLHNCAVADKGSIDDGQCRDWKNSIQLHNCAVADKGSIDDGQCRDWKNRVQL